MHTDPLRRKDPVQDYVTQYKIVDNDIVTCLRLIQRSESDWGIAFHDLLGRLNWTIARLNRALNALLDLKIIDRMMTKMTGSDAYGDKPLQTATPHFILHHPVV